MPKYAVVKADGAVEVIDGELGMKDVHKVIGDFEQMPSHPDIAVFASDELHDDMGFNWSATRLVQNFLMPTDRVFGTVIITGKADGKGDPTDIPQATVDTLTEWYEHRQ